MNRLILRAFFGLILSLTVGIPASGQIAESDKVLALVEESYRAPLAQLVNDFLRFRQLQQWDQLYDILSPRYTRRQSRDDYIREHQSLAASDRKNGQYSFYGCAIVYSQGQAKLANTHIDVVLENKVWRISGVGVFVTCVPDELECNQ